MYPIDRREMLKLSGALGIAATPFLNLDTAQGAEQPAWADGPPLLPPEGAFTVAVLPDTQLYSQKFPDQFIAQARKRCPVPFC